jgi:hypothetical protein
MYQRIENAKVRVEKAVLNQVGDLVPLPHGEIALDFDMNVDPQGQTALPHAKQVHAVDAGHRFGDLPDSIANFLGSRHVQHLAE